MTNSPQQGGQGQPKQGQQDQGQGKGQRDMGNPGAGQHGSNTPGQPNRQTGGADADRMSRKDGSKEGSK